MLLSGIADEAGTDLATQIRAHRTLGWAYIDLRNVDGAQFTTLDDAAFDAVCGRLADAGLKVSSFASGIANWACRIDDPFEDSVATLNRAIPRMRRLDCRYIRVMSYPNAGLPEPAWRDEAVRRMKALGRIAEDAGIVITVENCDGWASTSPGNYARFFELVDSPAVKAVYDTGNPASHGHTNTWDWYLHAKPHIAYIHIKDHTGPTADGAGEHVWPDAGIGCVSETLRDLAAGGYDGFVSIEPHLETVIHEGKGITRAEAAFAAYVEYGRRVAALVGEATSPPAT
ncbi:MAG: sugar phosphate isomerase/epimerase family protein [Rhodothermales bacterium]